MEQGFSLHQGFDGGCEDSLVIIYGDKYYAAMIWSSFNTAELLVCWIHHPQVSSILTLTSMQREGKATNEAVAALNTGKTIISRHAAQIGKTQKDFTALKKDSPTLR